MKPATALPLCLLKIYFNITSMARLLKWSLSFRFSHKKDTGCLEDLVVSFLRSEKGENVIQHHHCKSCYEILKEK
jgi:hypothetical protein